RIFVVLDSRHGSGLVNSVQTMGIPANRIVVWDANGVEHIYPRSVLELQFGAYESLIITDDVVTANGVSIRKRELANFVAARLTPAVEYPAELVDKLLAPLGAFLH